MAKPMPLDQQIVSALTTKTDSATIQLVIRDAETELRRLTGEVDTLQNDSLSPLLTRTEADEKRVSAADLQFEADRMDASLAALRNRLDEVTAQERKQAEDARHAAAIKERDELIADIRDQYPQAVRIITNLVRRIENAEMGSEAEAMARECAGTFRSSAGPIQRMREIHLPMPVGAAMAWDFGRIGRALSYPGASL